MLLLLYFGYMLLTFKKGSTQFFDNPLLKPEEIPPELAVSNAKYNTTAKLIELYGYTAEHHNVISEDGFLISVFRIPSDGPPVLFQHGLLVASDTWVVQGPQYDLAFILAERGYDVWLADMRGNSYSKGHLKYSSKNPKMWNFSFHEVGSLDMPAIINYILQMTKKPKLDVIGHSLGATSFLVMCSTRPEYCSKLRSFVALAPGIFLNSTHPTVIQGILIRYGSLFRYLNRKFRVHEFLSATETLTRTLKLMCRKDSPMYAMCFLYLQNIVGLTALGKHYPKSLMEYATKTMRGTSYKNLVHLTQMGQTGKLSYFDYGPKTNYRLYGTKYPAEYDLSLVTAPVALMYSDGDVHISSHDVNSLSTRLPNVILNYRIEKQPFNHADFIWGFDSKPIVYDVIMNILNHFDQTYPNS